MWKKIQDALYDDSSLYQKKEETLEDIKNKSSNPEDVQILNEIISESINSTDDTELKNCYKRIYELSDDTMYEYHKKIYLFNNGRLRTKKEIRQFHKMYKKKYERPKEIETSLDRYKFKGTDGDIVWTFSLALIPAIIFFPVLIIILPFVLLITGTLASSINLKIDHDELKVKLSKKDVTQQEIQNVKDMIAKDSASLISYGIGTFKTSKQTKAKLSEIESHQK